MRKLFAPLLALTTISAAAQQAAQQPAPPPAGSNWQHVQGLPFGTKIYVTTRFGNRKCNLTAVDADSLTCTQGKSTVFQRSDIQAIKLPRRGRSALLGLAIGGGVGFGIGYAIKVQPLPQLH